MHPDFRRKIPIIPIPTAKAILRQQLQQHLRNQHSALRGYGDYLRRNLRLILELAQDPTTVVGGGGSPGAQITAKEIDRLAFLFKPLHQRHGGCGINQCVWGSVRSGMMR